MNKYIAEFIGTFFLVLTIGCTGIGAGAGVIAPARHWRGLDGDDLCWRSYLRRALQSSGHARSSHSRQIKAADALPYMIAQVAAAAVAAFVVVGFLRAGIAVTPIAPKLGPALAAEFLFTFALVYVVLNAATADGTSGNSFYGLAIGMTVMTGAFAVGDISGGAFNPAVAVGISVMGISTWSNIWMYLVADFLGGAVAALVFNMINPPAQTEPIPTKEPPYKTP